MSTDVQAFGVLSAVRDHRLTVPDDVAIVSFDGIDASAFTSPPLTAIRIPRDTIARLCIEKLTSVPSAG